MSNKTAGIILAICVGLAAIAGFRILGGKQEPVIQPTNQTIIKAPSISQPPIGTDHEDYNDNNELEDND